MFPIKCKDLLPVDHLVIKSVAVRGRLGPLTVWVSNRDANRSLDNEDRNRRRSSRSSSRSIRSVLSGRHDQNREGRGEALPSEDHRVPLHPSSWTKLYEKKHDPCPRGQYTELVFNEPVRLRPGEMRALYIHSTLAGDQAIVYDNSYYGSSDKRFEDDKLSILTGRAHVSTTCFGQDPIWGWGNAWRDRREFVGRLAYGTVYKLWNPEVQPKFGSFFQDGARTLFLCQRRWESPLSMLPDEAIFYILNMCRWDWFDDSTNTMKNRRRREKDRSKLLLMEQQQQQEQQQIEAATSTAAVPMEEDVEEDSKPCAIGNACARSSRNQSGTTVGVVVKAGKTSGLDNSDEEDDDYIEMNDTDDSDDDDDMPVEADDDEDDMPGEADDDEDDDDVIIDSNDDGPDSDESSEEDDEYHRANRRHFSFHYSDSDEEDRDAAEQPDSRVPRNDWFRRQFARVHVLRALASMEDQAIGS